MNLLSFLKRKPVFFTAEEQARIVEAIRHAETATSGEIRVFVESRNAFVDPIDRARELFFKLKMDKTEQRNGVLLYMAMKDKQLALFGDEGIYKVTGADYWNQSVSTMIAQFKNEAVVDGMVRCITSIGETLKTAFPFDRETDKNELPDEIVFGH